MEEKIDQEQPKNLTEEQITKLGEYAGVTKGQSYCNMNNVFTNFVYFVSVLLGRPTESRTMNFDCFQRVFAELPADSYERLNKTMKAMKESLDSQTNAISAKRKAEQQMNKSEEKASRLLRQANRERHMSDILKHVIMERYDMSEDFYEY